MINVLVQVLGWTVVLAAIVALVLGADLFWAVVDSVRGCTQRKPYEMPRNWGVEAFWLRFWLDWERCSTCSKGERKSQLRKIVDEHRANFIACGT